MRCIDCDEVFDDEGAARDHVRDKHADVCDRKLEEYLEDSLSDAFEELITYDD